MGYAGWAKRDSEPDAARRLSWKRLRFQYLLAWVKNSGPPSDHVGVGSGTKPERRYLHGPRQGLAAPQAASTLFERSDSSGIGLERP